MTDVIKGKEGALLRIKESLNRSTDRYLIGIVGKPGAGKSTLSAYLLEELRSSEVTVVPMDGYHLSNAVLQALGRAERIRNEKSADVYYPVFDRSIEESIAAQGIVTKETKVVIVEGNYLLHDSGGWEEIAELLDELWFIDVDDEKRLERLIARHIAYGKSPADAQSWSRGSDEVNARTIAIGRSRAHAVIALD
jgi:pantothenate kinase